MNASRLALQLFCRGLRIDPSCELATDARGVRRTRARITVRTHPLSIHAGAIGAGIWGAFRHEKLASAGAR